MVAGKSETFSNDETNGVLGEQTLQTGDRKRNSISEFWKLERMCEHGMSALHLHTLMGGKARCRLSTYMLGNQKSLAQTTHFHFIEMLYNT